jgi:predicted lipid-binding transport protein (Tim44 family)
MKNLASQATCKNTPKPSKIPAPAIPSKRPNPPNAKSMEGGFFAITLTINSGIIFILQFLNIQSKGF